MCCCKQYSFNRAIYILLRLTDDKSVCDGEMKRISKDPEERRRELVDAAERLFTISGYEQTAISDIVNEVGVSQGTFYYYFDSKEDVLVAVLKKNIDVMEKDIRTIAERGDLDEAVKLNEMANILVKHAASGKKIMDYIHQDRSRTLHKRMRAVKPFANIAPIMAEVISRGSEKGRFDVVHPLETSFLLVHVLVSAHFMLFHAEGPGGMRCPEDGEHRQKLVAALESLLSRALGLTDYEFELQI